MDVAYNVVHGGSDARDNIVNYHIEVKLVDTIARRVASIVASCEREEIVDENVQRDDCPELKNAKKLHHVERKPFIRGSKRAVDLYLPTAIVFGTHEDQPSLLVSEPRKLIVKQHLGVDFFRLGHVAALMHCFTGPNEATVRHWRAQSHVVVAQLVRRRYKALRISSLSK